MKYRIERPENLPFYCWEPVVDELKKQRNAVLVSTVEIEWNSDDTETKELEFLQSIIAEIFSRNERKTLAPRWPKIWLQAPSESHPEPQQYQYAAAPAPAPAPAPTPHSSSVIPQSNGVQISPDVVAQIASGQIQSLPQLTPSQFNQVRQQIMAMSSHSSQPQPTPVASPQKNYTVTIT